MIAVLVILWMTEALHGYDIAFITMVGSMLFIFALYRDNGMEAGHTECFLEFDPLCRRGYGTGKSTC